MAGLTRLISPPVTVPSSTAPRVLGLGLGPVGVVGAVADVHVRVTALTAGRVLAQMQVDQVQPAELADPKARRRQPGHDQPVPRGVHRLPAASPALRRAASSDAGAAARLGASGLPAAGSSRGPATGAAGPPASAAGSVQLLTELGVDAERGVVQVEALQAGRRGRQRGRRTGVCPSARARRTAQGSSRPPCPYSVPGPAVGPCRRSRHSRSSHRR